MRYPQSSSIGLALSILLGPLVGCGNDANSSMEVRRTAEFQKAALNSRDAMIEHMKSQKKPKGSSRNR
ncbi:hypothetical protein ACYOEI_26695 [Singulisphaera rosea]